jgi:hypothetical protein
MGQALMHTFSLNFSRLQPALNLKFKYDTCQKNHKIIMIRISDVVKAGMSEEKST